MILASRLTLTKSLSTKLGEMCSPNPVERVTNFPKQVFSWCFLGVCVEGLETAVTLNVKKCFDVVRKFDGNLKICFFFKCLD